MAAVLAASMQPFLSQAHTPYRQWAVYRQKHLLIGCHKDDPATYELSKQIVARLDSDLPAASARVARAPATSRLASLLATDQLNIAVLAPETAVAMAAGQDVFAAYGSIPLTTLLPLKDYVLVGHSRLRDSHCWQITKALLPMTNTELKDAKPVLTWHTGSARFVSGEPMPEDN